MLQQKSKLYSALLTKFSDKIEEKQKMECKRGKSCCHARMREFHTAVTRIRTWVSSATTRGTDHYTITAIAA